MDVEQILLATCVSDSKRLHINCRYIILHNKIVLSPKQELVSCVLESKMGCYVLIS